MNTKAPLQNILQGILYTEDVIKQIKKKRQYQTTGEEKNKQSESSIGSAAHNQTLK
jgi:hypothetical protein